MTIHAATLSTIRQQIARIPAGPGRSADEFKEDLRRTLDCMEVAETLETPAEPLRLREGGWYRKRNGDIIGSLVLSRSLSRHGKRIYELQDADNFDSWSYDGTYSSNGRPGPDDLIAEVSAPNTICTPIVPVTVGRNTQIVDPDTGCLTELGAALLNGKDAQIAELRKMVERK